MDIYNTPLEQANAMNKKMTWLDAKDKLRQLKKQKVLIDDLLTTIDDWTFSNSFEDINEDKINDLKDYAISDEDW